MRRWMRHAHLYIGLFSSALILLLSVTGLLFNHRGWMGGGETVLYEAPGVSAASAGGHDHGGHRSAKGAGPTGLSLPEAVVAGARSGFYRLSDVAVVMDHGVVHVILNDEKRTNVLLDRQGRVLKVYTNPVAAWVRALHTGRVGDTDLTLLTDLGAVGMIALTGTGIVLSVKTLATQRKQKRKKKGQAGTLLPTAL